MFNVSSLQFYEMANMSIGIFDMLCRDQQKKFMQQYPSCLEPNDISCYYDCDDEQKTNYDFQNKMCFAFFVAFEKCQFPDYDRVLLNMN